MQELRTHKTIPQNRPAYDPQSNGCAERPEQEFTSTLRALTWAFEQRMNVQMTLNWNIIDWKIEHSATIINHRVVVHDGRTPYRRLTGKKSNRK